MKKEVAKKEVAKKLEFKKETLSNLEMKKVNGGNAPAGATNTISWCWGGCDHKSFTP
ncbi:hypothetical protein [Flavobacterium sp. PL02]|uniref:hypothetical protein n=1 Tax=Flavobacterium sp. PL02 TaxID=3088354 RepID=UPI000AB130A1|nr:hypothetical protein [Flavobacterium sp. PL02]MEA9413562.1 hypothetical protein [Flavobacterium sp. PL02]